MTKKQTSAELDPRKAKSLIGKTGDLTLSDGSSKKGLEVTEVKTKATILTVRDKAGASYPVDLDTVQEFTEYGTKWLGKAGQVATSNKSETEAVNE